MGGLKIPFFTTRLESDLILVFALTPVWWLTGLNLFIYHLTAVWIFFKLLTYAILNNRPVRVPRPVIIFFVFLVSYLVSITINVPLRPAQRIFASINNYTILIIGFLFMTVIYNCDARYLIKNFLKWGSRLCVLTTGIGLAILVLWMAGIKGWQIPTLIYKVVPSLMQYPYFTMLLTVTGTIPDVFEVDVPRLTIYSTVATSTGGLVLALIPLMGGWYNLNRRAGLFYYALLFLSLTVLVFTLARAAVIAIIGAYVVVTFLSKGRKTVLALCAFIAALTVSGALSRSVDWVLNVRQSSTVGRMNLYQEALGIVMDENPLLGVGVRLRDGFTMMAIGSHSLYIEIIFVAGIVGLFLFLFFQGLVVREWLSQKKFLKNETEKLIWKYMGMALIGMDIWLVTDTIFGPPLTPFVYFLICGGIMLFGDAVRKEGIPEPLG